MGNFTAGAAGANCNDGDVSRASRRVLEAMMITSPVSGQPPAVSPGTAALAQALGIMCTVHPRMAVGMLPCVENGG